MNYNYFVWFSELCSSQKSNDGRLERALQLLLLLLPAENWIMMKDVLQLLHLVASHEQSNKMSAENLATLFTPHLLCPRKVRKCNIYYLEILLFDNKDNSHTII